MKTLLARFDAREFLLLVGLVHIVVIGPLAGLTVLPEVRAGKSLTTELARLDSDSVDLSTQRQLLDGVEAEVEKLEKRLHGDAANLPAKELEAYIIGRLQSISWKNNVLLTAIRPLEGTPIDTFEETLFEINVGGDYFDLHRWLHDVSDDLGFVIVKQYRMEPGDNRRGDDRLNVVLTIATYRSAAS